MLRLRYGQSSHVRPMGDRRSPATVPAVVTPSPTPPSPPSGAGSLEPLVPVVLFLVVNRLAGLRWAVAAATIWSLKLVIDRRRRGVPLGVVMPVITIAVIARGVIGIITDSEDVYFGLGIASKFAIALVLFGSIAVRRPLAALGAPYVIDTTPDMVAHPAWLPTMGWITAIGGLYYSVSGAVDTWLLSSRSIEGFVLLRFLANWPLSIAAMIGAFAVAERGLRRIPGIDSVTDLVESRLENLTGQPLPGSTAGEAAPTDRQDGPE